MRTIRVCDTLKTSQKNLIHILKEKYSYIQTNILWTMHDDRDCCYNFQINCLLATKILQNISHKNAPHSPTVKYITYRTIF